MCFSFKRCGVPQLSLQAWPVLSKFVLANPFQLGQLKTAGLEKPFRTMAVKADSGAARTRPAAPNKRGL